MAKSVQLRPAKLDDRQSAWQWMCQSDATPSMMGPPDFPELEVPDFEDFCEDWVPRYWSDSQPEGGRVFVIVSVDGDASDEVGMCAYNDVHAHANGRKFAELDIWLRSEADCGRGYGSAAVALICAWLQAELGVSEVFAQPSARNPRSIRAFEKAGFAQVTGALDALVATYKTESDYPDSCFMVRALSA